MKANALTRILLAASSATAMAGAASAQEVGHPLPSPSAGTATTDTNALTGAESDIVVTARGRAERLLEAPVAVSVISGNQLASQAIKSTTQLTILVPALVVDTSTAGAGGLISLRGISSTASQAGFDQAVSIAIDGVQTGRARTLVAGLFDLQQVEVLEGPQALFFGKNSPGGVISVRTANPTDHLEAYVRGGYEFVGNEYTIEGAVSGPLAEGFGARLAVSYRNLDGYFRNGLKTPLTNANNPVFGFLDGGQPPLGLQRPGDKDLIGRLTLAYNPVGSGFNANLKISEDRYRSDGPDAGGQVVNCGGASAPELTFGPLTFFDPVGDCKKDFRYERSGYLPSKVDNWPYAKTQPYSSVNTFLTALNMNYQFSNMTLTSITGYLDLTANAFDGYDYTSFNQINASEREHYKAGSQEFRLASNFSTPINFVFGAYYQHTNLYYFNASSIAPGPDDGSVSGPENIGKFQSWERPNSTIGNTYSAFGQVRWNIAARVELAGGVRFTREVKRSRAQNTYVNSALAGLLLPPDIIYRSKFAGHNWSPEATLTYKPTPTLTFYGGYRTGYKSGGFGLSSVLTRFTSVDDLSFRPERIAGFEVGAKGQAWDRLLTFNLSAYTYKYKNLQVSEFQGNTLSFLVTNAGSARIKGIEASAQLHPLEQLSLNGSINYNSAKYIDFQNLAGKRLNQAPAWTGTASFNYEASAFSGWTMDFSGNLRMTSKYETQASDDPRSVQKGFTTIDGSIRLTAPQKRYDIALIGHNLTNKAYVDVTESKPGAVQYDQISGVPHRGREIALQLTARY